MLYLIQYSTHLYLWLDFPCNHPRFKAPILQFRSW